MSESINFTHHLSIVLLASKFEYDSGAVYECLNKYFKDICSVDKKIDLFIFFNNGDPEDYADLLGYKTHPNINDVFVLSCDLQGLDDLYARTPAELQKLNLKTLPTLGGSAGPNNLFFSSMNHLSDSNYRDLLMIECDTQPIADFWLDKIVNYCDNNKFMIAGSTYKGKQDLPMYEAWTGHLNGVAIYRNSSHLHMFFKLSKKTIAYKVANGKNHFISFDVGMHAFLGTQYGRKHFNNRDNQEYHLIDSPIISNYSLPIDSDTTINSVKKQYPQTIILHKKWN